MGSKNAAMESVLAASLRRPRGAPLSALLRHARLSRRTALIALAGAALLTGGFLLFRSSPIVAVEEVDITGVSGPEAAAISQALDSTAKGMSTLDYSASALSAAVSQYKVVRSVRVSTSFPHAMRIEVSEQLPVAALSAGGLRTAVAADGVVLGSALLSRALPSIAVPVAPAVGRRVSDARLRSYLTVLGAAPGPLLRLISRVFTGQQGLTLRMRDGLLVYFGDASRPHAKWDSLVTVLIAQGSQGASYVDVRLPERPAAGVGGGGVGSGGVGSGESGQVSASDPTSAVLAASLAKAVNGEPAAPVSSTAMPPSTTSGTSATPSQEPSTAGGAGLGAAEASTSEGAQTSPPTEQAEGG